MRGQLAAPQERQIGSLEDYINSFQFAGSTYYPSGVQQTMPGQTAEAVPNDFTGYAIRAATNGVLSACMDVRKDVFSSARFAWQRLNNGRPSEMFGTTDLQLLEKPWPGGTTQDLLARVIQDADLAGNSYWAREGDELVRMRPDWVQIVLEPRQVRDGILGYRRIGYLYYEGGINVTHEPVPFLVDEVAHFAPKPDPLATYRGMSWMTPVIRETTSDGLMSAHKQRFFENAATPNLVVRLDREVSPEAFEKFKAKMDSGHRGAENAYKTLYLGGGADVTVVGSSFSQMDFTKVQGAGETRVAAAAGVPPVIVGLSEGLAAATYSNYSQARRRFADGTMHPLWGNVAGSFAHLVRPARAGDSGAVRLWYDPRDVPFLREDRKDAADIAFRQAQTIRSLVDAGFTPDSTVRAVEAEDYSLLVHTGLFSVQLQPPGTTMPTAEPAPPTDEEGL
ncbi:phage portal protein [Streptomyces erythrochromogenes]|uniref:phage portal protein n=1 Tax=Streptomyces erythrochromogenes TaxID=285574 RepID=UPI0022575EB5|nr:phage portal protein [Streptomyces erythrochromogenes]MCX5584275.1 phage portal protein [Streptomyces erythrochromogenes]